MNATATRKFEGRPHLKMNGRTFLSGQSSRRPANAATVTPAVEVSWLPSILL